MGTSGKQKAAMLLTSLDAETASELLKELPPKDIEDIGIELALIDASARRDTATATKIAHEFYESIQKKQKPAFTIRGFFNEMLASILGEDKAEQVQSQIKKVTEKGDPFMAIRSATVDELLLTLENEHPQTIAVILLELTTRKSQEVLSLLKEKIQCEVIHKMTNPADLSHQVRRQMASMISERLQNFKGETFSNRPGRKEQSLRKLAITLSGLERTIRDRLLDEIHKEDEKTATMVRNLMVTWDDIPSIADRSLQECLRSVESSKLALALYEADEEIVQKIRSNISERLVATLDEEVALMQEPLDEEVAEAREEVVKPLREANEEGKLRRVRHR